MIILRQKEFGTTGRIWAGTKGAIKTGVKGALIGSVLAPGNLYSLNKGKYKRAAILTGIGATVGAAIGSKIGYDKGVNEYKYNNDPEYRKKVDEENKIKLDKTIESLYAEDLYFTSEFDYKSWSSLKNRIDVPDEFLKYVKFYKEVWAKKVDDWYKNIDVTKIKEWYDIPEFKVFFPIPIGAELAEEWYDEYYGDLCLATVNNAGDDGWLYYSTESGKYGWDIPNGFNSLKDLLLKSLKSKRKDNLSDIQKKLLINFENKIKSL